MLINQQPNYPTPSEQNFMRVVEPVTTRESGNVRNINGGPWNGRPRGYSNRGPQRQTPRKSSHDSSYAESKQPSPHFNDQHRAISMSRRGPAHTTISDRSTITNTPIYVRTQNPRRLAYVSSSPPHSFPPVSIP